VSSILKCLFRVRIPCDRAGPSIDLLRACLGRIFCFENHIEFFESAALGLDIEQVDEDKLEEIPEHEKDVEPIFDLF
jgi:hypothetical protein